MDTMHDSESTGWVLFTWPMLALLLITTLLAGAVLGGLIERARSR